MRDVVHTVTSQCFETKLLSLLSFTSCGSFVDFSDGDVGSVVAVAGTRLGEAVHVKQLPVGHLPVRVKHLLAFMNRAHADHLQAILKKCCANSLFKTKIWKHSDSILRFPDEFMTTIPRFKLILYIMATLLSKHTQTGAVRVFRHLLLVLDIKN